MNSDELGFVADMSIWDSGGGLELDLITLKDGRVLAISDDVVVLYESMDDLVAGEAKERPMLAL